jgi:hypothetical protein
VSRYTVQGRYEILSDAEAGHLDQLIQARDAGEMQLLVQAIGNSGLLLKRRSGPPPLFTYRQVRSTTLPSNGTPSSSMNLDCLTLTCRSSYEIAPTATASTTRRRSGRKCAV